VPKRTMKTRSNDDEEDEEEDNGDEQDLGNNHNILLRFLRKYIYNL
jgi:hypothetical protein